jgi:hypothetical protein
MKSIMKYLTLAIALACGVFAHSLADVHKIYVGSLGADSGAALIREKLIGRLLQSGKVTVVTSLQDADAVLTGVGQLTGRDYLTATATNQVATANAPAGDAEFSKVCGMTYGEAAKLDSEWADACREGDRKRKIADSRGPYCHVKAPGSIGTWTMADAAEIKRDMDSDKTTKMMRWLQSGRAYFITHADWVQAVERSGNFSKIEMIKSSLASRKPKSMMWIATSQLDEGGK